MAFPGRGVTEEGFGLLQGSQQNRQHLCLARRWDRGRPQSPPAAGTQQGSCLKSLSARVFHAPVSEHHMLLCSQVRSGVPFQILQLWAGEEIPARHI